MENQTPSTANNQQLNGHLKMLWDSCVTPGASIGSAADHSLIEAKRDGYQPSSAVAKAGRPPTCQCNEEFIKFCKMHAISHADCLATNQYKCWLCSQLTDQKSYQWHLSSDRHKQRHTQLMEYVYLLSLPIQSPSLAMKLTQVLDINRQHLALDKVEVTRRLQVVDLINELIHRNGLLDYSVRLYGSSITGFALKDYSDINLDIVCKQHSPDTEGGDDNRSTDSVAIVLSKISEIIQRNANIFFNVRNEYNLKVPKVRFKDRKYGFEIELSITVEKSYRASRLLQQYCQIDDRVVTLGLALREWARMCRFDDQENGLWPAFAFPILTIHFLQRCQPPVLPCLHELNNKRTANESNQSQTQSNSAARQVSPEDNDGLVEDEFNLQSLNWFKINNKSVGQLWLEMLRYYAAEFDAETYVVSIRTTLPVMMRTDKKWSTRMLAIEDPTRPQLNLSRSVGSMRLYNVFIEQIRHSFKYFATPFVNLVTDNYASTVRSSPLYTERDFEILVNETHFYDNLDVSDLLSQISNIGNELTHETNDSKNHKLSDDSDNDDNGDDSKKDNFYMISNKILKTFGIRMQLSRELEGTLQLIPATKLYATFQINKMPYFEMPPKFCRLCHRHGHFQNRCPENELPPLKPMPEFFDITYDQLLNNICYNIFDNKKMDRNDEQIQEMILSDLEEFIRREIPNARLELFGSTKNGFGARFCDLDICLTFDYNPTGEGLEFARIIEEVGLILKTHKLLQNIIPITSAKVPIVKFGYNFDRNRTVECDISLYNILARYNTQWLRLYTQIDSRVQVLGFVVKHFAKTCDMCDASRGSLSSYAYTLMTIHYLQQKRIIPVLQEIGLDRHEERLVDGWDTWFFNDLQTLKKCWNPTPNNESVGQLFIGFLRYYSEVFNFDDNVVCCRQLAPLKRLEKMWTGCKIAIEDPFLLSHNLGAGVSPQMAVYIRTSIILGRNLFAIPPINGLDPRYRYWDDYFFDRRLLTHGAPPTGRGCRNCGKIGHKQNKCPERPDRQQRGGHDRHERYVRPGDRNDRHERPDRNRDKPPVKPPNMRRKYNISN